jgi:uncharacterized protein (TIGR03067 family)
VAAPKSQTSGKAQNDIKNLQGLWQVVKFIDHSEQAAPSDELKDHTFEFKGDKVTQRKGKDDVGQILTYTLDVSKKPKWMTIVEAFDIEGIFKLDGEELTLCFVGGMVGEKVTPRPTEFKARKNPPYSLLVLKKVKK